LLRILNRLGINNVVVVGNGQQAVDREAAEPFDVVLMDMQMPVMDGVEACEIIMKRQGGHQQQSRLLPLTRRI
jgi:CheY-like chemotaxis protein